MHEIQKDHLRQRPFSSILIYRHHIIFIELRDPKFRIHRLLVPGKVPLLGLVAPDQQRTDRIQDHRLVIHLIDPL